ncbi:MAG: insulinase family protein [Bacteroidales bacterium]|nr:insulinase family protein [Bacteroidales bacterium]
MKVLRKMLTVALAFAVVLTTAGGNAFAQKKTAKHSGAKDYEIVKNDPTNTRIYTLPNGLTVYLSVIKKEPRIQTYIAVRTGSKNDPHETTGLSHYLEHIMFKGTTHFGTINYQKEKPMLDQIEKEFEYYRALKDPAARKAEYHKIDSISFAASKLFVANEYDKLMGALGSKNSNAFTSNDMTVYQEDIPSNQVEAWAKIQSDRFENMVIRGFHTELEAVYEEDNLGLSDDQGRAYDTLMFSLFKNHPYGLQTTIGTQEHLKNPSITNIWKHYHNFYVPNNVAICMAGDFNPDQAITIIRKYFGSWKRNDNLKLLKFKDEQPIAKHIEKTVYGQESPLIYVGWRFPSAYRDGRTLSNIGDTLYMVSNILNNRGDAGLIDMNVNRPQKVLSGFAGNQGMTDYNIFLVGGEPKEGQSLTEVKNILFEQLEKVKRGEFDESMLTAIVNNWKRSRMQNLDSYQFRARMMYGNFINRTPWSYTVEQGERLSKIKKEDIVKFVNKYFNDNYVQVNKVVGIEKGIQKIEKPAITAINTNRDTSSQFLRDMEKMIGAAKPIEPVYVDFAKEMSIGKNATGQDVYYKHNDDNSLFYLTYYFPIGTYDSNKLDYALYYFNNLGTDKFSSDQIKSKLYTLACSLSGSSYEHTTEVSINGLSENMKQASDIVEGLLANVKPDEQLLSKMKENWKKQLMNAKTDKDANAQALETYTIYGPENPQTHSLKPSEIDKLTAEELVNIVKDLFRHQYSVIYYGPLAKDKAVAELNTMHKGAENLAEYAPSRSFEVLDSKEPTIFIAPYKATQINIYGICNYGEKLNPSERALVKLYDTYFGSGMSSIVFQDLREAKGLAYHAAASHVFPYFKDKEPLYYEALIYTQNDKMMDALRAYNSILTDMPVSQKSFDVAKSNSLQNLATKRYTGAGVIWYYLSMKRQGFDYDINKDIYNNLKALNLQSIIDYQQNNIRNRKYNIGIVGNTEELDLNSLAGMHYGKIVRLTTPDIFGY